MARNKNTKAPFFFPSEVNATNILKGSSKLTLDPTTEFLGKTYEAQVLFPFIVPAGTPNLPPMPGTITSDRATGDTDASNNSRARIACFARITSDPDTHIGIPDPRDINVHKGIKQNFMKYAKNHPIYVWGYAGETSNNTLGIGDVIQVYHSENYHEEYGRIIERIGISKLDDIPWLKTAKGMFEGRATGPLNTINNEAIISGLKSPAKEFVETFIERAEVDLGITISLNSGHRSNERQQELIDEWKAGGREGPEPAAPGASLHNSALAVDFNAQFMETGVVLGTKTPKEEWIDSGLIDLAKSIDREVRWGGEFSTNYDPIHFDFLGQKVAKAEKD